MTTSKIVTMIAALLMCACGTVRTTDAKGNAQWHIRSNAATMDIVERGHGNFEFHATGLDNATPTTAALTGAQDITNTVVTGAVAAYATHGLTGSAKLLTPAAPLGSSAFKSRNATPAALQAH